MGPSKMIRFALVGLSLCLADVCRADYASEFRDKVKALDEKYQDIDKRAGSLISDTTKADFKKYAEIRNEIIRFISEPRQEIQRARAVGDQNSAQRIQTEQELKIVVSDLD